MGNVHGQGDPQCCGAARAELFQPHGPGEVLEQPPGLWLKSLPVLLVLAGNLELLKGHFGILELGSGAGGCIEPDPWAAVRGQKDTGMGIRDLFHIPRMLGTLWGAQASRTQLFPSAVSTLGLHPHPKVSRITV